MVELEDTIPAPPPVMSMKDHEESWEKDTIKRDKCLFYFYMNPWQVLGLHVAPDVSANVLFDRKLDKDDEYGARVDAFISVDVTDEVPYKEEFLVWVITDPLDLRSMVNKTRFCAPNRKLCVVLVDPQDWKDWKHTAAARRVLSACGFHIRTLFFADVEKWMETI